MPRGSSVVNKGGRSLCKTCISGKKLTTDIIILRESTCHDKKSKNVDKNPDGRALIIDNTRIPLQDSVE